MSTTPTRRGGNGSGTSSGSNENAPGTRSVSNENGSGANSGSSENGPGTSSGSNENGTGANSGSSETGPGTSSSLSTGETAAVKPSGGPSSGVTTPGFILGDSTTFPSTAVGGEVSGGDVAKPTTGFFPVASTLTTPLGGAPARRRRAIRSSGAGRPAERLGVMTEVQRADKVKPIPLSQRTPSSDTNVRIRKSLYTDVVLILDFSFDSANHHNMRRQLFHLLNFTRHFSRHVRVGLVATGDQGSLIVSRPPRWYHDGQSLGEAAGRMGVGGEKRDTAKALREIRLNIFNGSHSDASQIVVLITDLSELSHRIHRTLFEADLLESSGVEIFVVAKSSELQKPSSTDKSPEKTDREKLLSIASRPVDGHLYLAKNNDHITTALSQIMNQIKRTTSHRKLNKL